MLLAIQLALLAMGVVVVLRGRMCGIRGHEVIGMRARLAGLVMAAMAGWSTASGLMVEHIPQGVHRLSVVGMQAVWLLGAMILASMIAGSGMPEEAVAKRGQRLRRAA